MEIQTKDKIILATEQLFYKYGVKRMTMDDIAKHLAMSKKTLYQFYNDKEELVIAIASESIRRHQADLLNIQKEAKDPIDEFFLVSKYMLKELSKINPVFFFDIQKHYPLAWQKFLEFKMDCARQTIEDNLIKGIQLGLYRKDINVKLYALHRVYQVDMALNNELYNPENYTVVEVNQSLLDMYMHGITTIKGHKLINKYKELSE